MISPFCFCIRLNARINALNISRGYTSLDRSTVTPYKNSKNNVCGTYNFTHIFFAPIGPIFLPRSYLHVSCIHAKNERNRSAIANLLKHFRLALTLCWPYGPLTRSPAPSRTRRAVLPRERSDSSPLSAAATASPACRRIFQPSPSQ